MFTDGMSRLAVGVTLTVALSFACFLTILILLLADLFCANLRRRRLHAASRPKLDLWSPPHTAGTADDASVATTHEALSSTPPFYYAHGVMHAPNPKELLLAIPKLEAAMWRWSPARRSSASASASTSSSAQSDRFVCISNPVYERSDPAATGGDTPFETPNASPSPLEIGEEDEEAVEYSPPLTAMKKLPPVFAVECPPTVPSFVDGRQSLTAGSWAVTDTNRASSSLSTFTTHFSSWSSK